MFWFGSARGGRMIFVFPLLLILLLSSHSTGRHPGMWWLWMAPFWIIPSLMRSHARRHRPRTTVAMPARPPALADPPRGDLRVGDAERDRTTASLRDHLMAGRITSDEFDERIAATLRARTWDDLRAVTRDLPAKP